VPSRPKAGASAGKGEEAEKAADMGLGGLLHAHEERRGRGKGLCQLWFWAKREGREKKEKRSFLLFSVFANLLKFKQSLNSSHPTPTLHSNKNYAPA